MRFSVLLSAVVLTLGTAVSADDAPYSFRNAQLGMRLSDFKKMPFPDETYRGSILTTCTNDRSWRSYSHASQLPPALAQAGVVLCTYMRNVPPLGYLEWAPQVGNTDGYMTSYLFSKSPEGEFRLYQIQIYPNNSIFPTVLDLLTRKYGVPTSSKSKQVSTVGGAVLTDEIMTWENQTSSIIIESLVRNIHGMSITYLHKVLSEAVLKALDRQTDDAAKKL